MGRAEYRRKEREGRKAKTATYNLTEEQLEAIVLEKFGEKLKRAKQEAMDEAINTAMVLLLALPMKVLMDHYWPKTSRERIPRFTEYVLEYYRKWQDGELDMEELEEELWEYGGVRLKREDRERRRGD